MTYYITIEETVVHSDAVEADTPEEALRLGETLFAQGDIEEPGERQSAKIAVGLSDGTRLIDFQEMD